ncbi:MAG TPA: ZIP family metal transporter [Gammaproteobacteria bacterium]
MNLDTASPVVLGLLGSLVAGLGTGAGALPVLFAVSGLSQRAYTLMLGFAAGVMLAATAFSLIVPGLEAAAARVGAGLPGALLIAAGTLLGGLALSRLHRFVPHEHFMKGHEGPPMERVSRLWLFVFAIALHNFPEGLAVGVGFGGDEPLRGVSLATGIGLQNLPEGFAVAAALASLGYSRSTAFAIALGTGLIEPLGGLIGVVAVTLAAPLLPWALAFAAGAMLYVVSGEIIPETHREGSETRATFAVLAGFALMMVLDASIV